MSTMPVSHQAVKHGGLAEAQRANTNVMRKSKGQLFAVSTSAAKRGRPPSPKHSEVWTRTSRGMLPTYFGKT